MHTSIAAVVVYHGVLAEETDVFRFVLARIPDVDVVIVGAKRGAYAGPGGVEQATAALDEIADPQIVVIPGGLGCHRHTEIVTWLRNISPAWVLASSTGSALLATAGLLHETAATHWLAGSLLERYGIHPADEQLIVDGGVVTSAGRSSAFRAALIVAQAYGGPGLVTRIRADAAAAQDPQVHDTERPWWRRLLETIRRQAADEDEPSSGRKVGDPEVLDLGRITPPPPRDRRLRYLPAASATARNLAT